MNRLVYNYMSNIKWAPRTVTLGIRNRDKVFMIIRRKDKSVGLFSYVLSDLGYIKEAISTGYVPVIDMKNYDSPYRDKNSKVNVWEYYFQQPMGYTLDDVKFSYKVSFTSGDIPNDFPGLNLLEDSEKIEEWRKIYHQYVRFNKETEIYTKGMCNKLIGGFRTLGVLCRGTDYRYLKPKLHPIQPEIEKMITDAKLYMEMWSCDKLYLATEDRAILKRFKHEFGDKLIFPEFVLREYDNSKLISTIEIEREEDRKLKGLEYLTQIYILSKCNCFLGSGCGGTYGALLMSDGFENQYLYNLGVY